MDKGQPIRPPEMRNIERQGSSGGTAWQVSIKRGSPKRAYSKSFNFSRYADEEAALAAAQAWRDEMERLHPKLTRKDRLMQPTTSTSSGKTGVYRSVTYYQRRDGHKHPLINWVAWTPEWVTPHRVRGFSVAKYGEEEAFRLALAAREAFEAELGEAAHKEIMPKKMNRHSPEMRCIYREDKHRVKTWQVNVTRGTPARSHRKNFPDSQYGGEEPALAAARSWRDEMNQQHPKLTKKKHATKLIKSNTSGKTGVMRVSAISTRTDGTETVISSWQAKSPAAIKPRRTRSFSVEKNGEQEAYRLAVEARLAFEALLGDSV